MRRTEWLKGAIVAGESLIAVLMDFENLAIGVKEMTPQTSKFKI